MSFESSWCAAHGHSAANPNVCLACGTVLNREAVPQRKTEPKKKARKR